MKTIWMAVIVALVTVVYTSAILAQQTSITIDQIREDEWISGYVSGLELTDHANYKVIVYVHTDKWYIHPYAGQDEGLSWTTIQQDNTWKIKTVKRRFKADKMAVLLVGRDYPEPNHVEQIERIPHKAFVVKNLKGTSDYGKL